MAFGREQRVISVTTTDYLYREKERASHSNVVLDAKSVQAPSDSWTHQVPVGLGAAARCTTVVEAFRMRKATVGCGPSPQRPIMGSRRLLRAKDEPRNHPHFPFLLSLRKPSLLLCRTCSRMADHWWQAPPSFLIIYLIRTRREGDAIPTPARSSSPPLSRRAPPSMVNTRKVATNAARAGSLATRHSTAHPRGAPV